MNSNSMEYSSLKSEDFNGKSKSNFWSWGGANEGLKQPFNINLKEMSLGTIAICVIVIIVVILFVTKVFDVREGMSGGTLTQMFAQDAQNANLNSASQGIQSGDFDLYFNQPTRIANPNGTQRGVPMPKIAFPDTDMSPMKTQNNEITPDKKTTPCGRECEEGDCRRGCGGKGCGRQQDEQVDKCIRDPASCGNGSGGARLGTGFVEPIEYDAPSSYVGLNGKIVYPNGYLGSLWVPPSNPDPMKPLKIMETDKSMTSKPYLPYVKEGYE